MTTLLTPASNATPAPTALALPCLFYSEGSPYARICRMALRERGLLGKVSEAITTLRDPAAPVLPHNPLGRVPALVLDNGITLSETILVMQWLDRLGEAPALMPQTAQALAAYGCAQGLMDCLIVWNRELRRPEADRNMAVVRTETERAERVADALERQVAAGVFAQLDGAYLALAAVLGYVDRRHRVWQWRTGRPQLSAWFEQASQRSAFVETVPPLNGI